MKGECNSQSEYFLSYVVFLMSKELQHLECALSICAVAIQTSYEKFIIPNFELALFFSNLFSVYYSFFILPWLCLHWCCPYYLEIINLFSIVHDGKRKAKGIFTLVPTVLCHQVLCVSANQWYMSLPWTQPPITPKERFSSRVSILTNWKWVVWDPLCEWVSLGLLVGSV